MAVPADVPALFHRYRDAIEQLLGPARSKWSGDAEQYEVNLFPGPCPIVSGNGIGYDKEQVGRPLQALLDDARAGRVYDLSNQRDARDLRDRKVASYLAVYTQVQLVTPGGEPYRRPDKAGERAIEEAFTDAFVVPNLDEINWLTGVGEAVPGLGSIDLPTELTDYNALNSLWGSVSPHAQTARDVAAHFAPSGQSPEEALRLVNQQNCVGKQHLIADWVISKGEVPPPPEPMQVDGMTPHSRIVSALNRAFVGLREGDSEDSGHRVIGALDQEVRDVRQDIAYATALGPTRGTAASGGPQVRPDGAQTRPATAPKGRGPGGRASG